MSKYTPGPWEFDSHGGCFYVLGPKGEMIADGDTDEGYITRMRGVGRGATEEEQGANARLIAASPDLLAELQEANAIIREQAMAIVKHVPGGEPIYMLNIRLDEREAAIAKAEEPAR